MTLFRIDQNWQISFSVKLDYSGYAINSFTKKLQLTFDSNIAVVSETRFMVINPTTGAFQHSVTAAGLDILAIGTLQGQTDNSAYLATRVSGTIRIAHY